MFSKNGRPERNAEKWCRSNGYLVSEWKIGVRENYLLKSDYKMYLKWGSIYVGSKIWNFSTLWVLSQVYSRNVQFRNLHLYWTIRIIPVAKWSRSRCLNIYALVLRCRPKLLRSLYAVITSYVSFCHLMRAYDDCWTLASLSDHLCSSVKRYSITPTYLYGTRAPLAIVSMMTYIGQAIMEQKNGVMFSRKGGHSL